MIKGSRLKELRKNKGMTQDELGKAIGVTKASVCCYEKGTRTPTIEVFLAMMCLFNVSGDYLLGNDNFITLKNEKERTYILSKEEMNFILELRKNKFIYEILLDDVKRGISLLDKKIG